MGRAIYLLIGLINMRYFPNLSVTLEQDIFINNNGLVYLQQGTNMHHIGSTSSSIAELRNAMDKYI